MEVKPIIKWVGGKTQIVNTIIDMFPQEICDYHEPFVGGGSVLLALLSQVKKNKIVISGEIFAYDVNETLIYMYKNIQLDPTIVFIETKNIIDEFYSIIGTTVQRKPTTAKESLTSRESYYYWIRKQYNEMSQIIKNSPIGTAHLIFLNKTCFRGLYRIGPNGFNVPYGNNKNPEIINEEHIMAFSELIRPVHFIHSHFDDTFSRITTRPQNFLYLDPPYVPEKKESFVDYTENGFNHETHELLFSLCKGHSFIMSNSNTELVLNTFNDTTKFNIIGINVKRRINSKNPEATTNEIIIKSIP